MGIETSSIIASLIIADGSIVALIIFYFAPFQRKEIIKKL